MIYAVWAKTTPYVKFGYVKFKAGMKRRLELLQCGCPHVLECLAMVEGTGEQERALHEMLKDSWHRGEWFKLDTNTKQIIALMIEGKPFSEWRLTPQSPPQLRRVLFWAQNYDNKDLTKALRVRTRRAGEVWSFSIAKGKPSCSVKQGRSKGRSIPLPV